MPSTRFGNRTGLTGNGVWDSSWRSGCPRDGIADLSGRLTVIARRDGVLENRLRAAVSGEVPEAAADGCGGPRNRAGRPRLRPCRRGRRECDVGAAVHRDRRHDHASGCGRCRLEVRHREGRAAACPFDVRRVPVRLCPTFRGRWSRHVRERGRTEWAPVFPFGDRPRAGGVCRRRTRALCPDARKAAFMSGWRERDRSGEHKRRGTNR